MAASDKIKLKKGTRTWEMCDVKVFVYISKSWIAFISVQHLNAAQVSIATLIGPNILFRVQAFFIRSEIKFIVSFNIISYMQSIWGYALESKYSCWNILVSKRPALVSKMSKQYINLIRRLSVVSGPNRANNSNTAYRTFDEGRVRSSFFFFFWVWRLFSVDRAKDDTSFISS